MDVQKIIYVAVPIIVLVIVVAAVMTVARTGKTTFSSANSDLTNSLSSMSTGAYDLYDGAEVNGGTVIDVINETWKDANIEVCVSTVDPSNPAAAKNIVYNKFGANDTPTNTWSGGAKAIDIELNANPATLAAGTACPASKTDAGWWTPCIGSSDATNQTAYESGYFKNSSASTPGYISPSSTFIGSVQRDGNGDVRRITFVQQ